MSRYVVYGVKPWCEDTELGEFTDMDKANQFKDEKSKDNKETKEFAYIACKVYL